MKVLVIYNNFAANNTAVKRIQELKNELEHAGIDYKLIHTNNSAEAVKTVSEINFAEFDTIAGMGGDGTIFNLLNGYMANVSEKRIPISVIPAGTGNALARDLGFKSKSAAIAVRAIKKGVTKKIDVGRFNTEGKDYYFSNIIGLGFVTDVARTAHKLKSIGSLSYTLGVLLHTVNLKSFTAEIEFDGIKIKEEATFIEISNTKYTGKDFLMAPEASIDDGLFDITIMTKASRFKLLSGLPKIFSGSHVHMKEVKTFRAKSIKINTGSPKILTPDGEILGTTPLQVECLQKNVEFIVNTN